MKHLLVEAAFRRPVKRIPVWFMRQAGRYLSEYRAVRERKGGFLEMCYDSDAAAEVSLQPYDIFGVDAVIIFSDILTPLIPMGMDIVFKPGPIVNNPIKNIDEIRKLKLYDPSSGVNFVGEILEKVKKTLAGKIPVIGFAGAPFTLAVYMLGRDAGDSAISLKLLANKDRQAYHELMSKLTKMTIDYLNYQINSGAQMIQLFDTWAGNLSTDDFKEFCLPYVTEILSNLNREGVPLVYFVNGGSHLLDSMPESGADMVGIDWRTDITKAHDLIGDKVALQGNLDPASLFSDQDTIRRKSESLLNFFKEKPGYVFNLGHGIHKETPRENVRFLVDLVQSYQL